MSEAVNVTRQLPRDMQGIIATGLSMVAIRDHQADHKIGNLKSIGTDKVLPLYKSKNKRRDYDQVSEFHMAMNYLQILEEPERRDVSGKMIELVEFARDYLEKCRYTAILPEKRKVERIRDIYLGLEREKARQYLETIRQEFLTSLQVQKSEPAKQDYISDGSTIHLGGF